MIKKVYAEVSIKAEVDKTVISRNDTISYKVIIISDEKNIPSPHFPNFSGFSIISQNKSSHISIGKTINTKITYMFILSPQQSGRLRIEPTSIKIKNKLYYTEGFDIEVKETDIPYENKPYFPEENLSPDKEVIRITI